MSRKFELNYERYDITIGSRNLSIEINTKILDKMNWTWNGEINKSFKKEVATIYDSNKNEALHFYANGEDWILEESFVFIFGHKEDDKFIVDKTFKADNDVPLINASKLISILIEEFIYHYEEETKEA